MILALLTILSILLKTLPSLDNETALELLLVSGYIGHLLYSAFFLWRLNVGISQRLTLLSSLKIHSLSQLQLSPPYRWLSNLHQSDSNFILESQTQISNYLWEICTRWTISISNSICSKLKARGSPANLLLLLNFQVFCFLMRKMKYCKLWHPHRALSYYYYWVSLSFQLPWSST